MTNKSARRILWLLVVIVSFFLLYPILKRAFPGHLIRFWITKQSIGRQIANDLADDVRHKRGLRALQPWSAATLEQYRAGQLVTTNQVAFFSKGSVRVESRRRLLG